MFCYLDNHAGGITALATILLVVLTGIYVWLNKCLADETKSLAKATKDMVSEMVRQWQATQDSDVWAKYTPSDDGGQGEYYLLVVENLGPSTAFNVHFKPNPEWSAKTANGIGLGVVGMLAHGIPALASGQQRMVKMKLKAKDGSLFNPLLFTAYWRNSLGEEKQRTFELQPDQVAHESEVRLN